MFSPRQACTVQQVPFLADLVRPRASSGSDGDQPAAKKPRSGADDEAAETELAEGPPRQSEPRLLAQTEAMQVDSAPAGAADAQLHGEEEEGEEEEEEEEATAEDTGGDGLDDAASEGSQLSPEEKKSIGMVYSGELSAPAPKRLKSSVHSCELSGSLAAHEMGSHGVTFLSAHSFSVCQASENTCLDYAKHTLFQTESFRLREIITF